VTKRPSEDLDLIDEAPPEEAPAVPSQDEARARLREIALQFADSVGDEEASAAKVKEALEFLSRLTIKEFQEWADHPFIEMLRSQISLAGLAPGEVRNRGTLAEVVRDWTYADLTKLETIRFTPTETIVVTFNGLPLQFVEDVECEAPKPYYDILQARKFARQQARLNEAYMLGKSPIAPHPNWQTPEGAEVRAWSMQGAAYGRPGGYLGVGPINEGS